MYLMSPNKLIPNTDWELMDWLLFWVQHDDNGDDHWELAITSPIISIRNCMSHYSKKRHLLIVVLKQRLVKYSGLNASSLVFFNHIG